MRESSVPTITEPPEAARGAIARLCASGGPITEAYIEATLTAAGVSPHVVMQADRYRRWLTSLASGCEAQSLSPWASVPDAVASGRAQVLDALGSRDEEAVPCSRLQVARDIGVMVGAFLASGAAIAVPVWGGFSRAQVLRHGWRQLMRRPLLAMRMMRPAWRIDLHTNDRLIHRFDEAAWSAMHASIEVVLSQALMIDGVVGTAWYYDRDVARVSPRLNYLRTLTERSGALFIDFAPRELDTAFALKRSVHRRLAASRGEYVPHATLFYAARP